MMKITQISESIRLGALLAISGGMMDAYSYIMRGHVFANAQTGNMLLFGVNLSEGNFQTALTYFCPILAFTIGIMLADVFRMKSIEMLHWRQISVLIEAVILFGVAFIPLPLSAGKQPDFSCLRHSGRKFSKDSRTRHRHDNVYRKPAKCHTEYV